MLCWGFLCSFFPIPLQVHNFFPPSFKPSLNPSFSEILPIIPPQRDAFSGRRCPCFWISRCYSDVKFMCFDLLSSLRERFLPGVAHHFMSSTMHNAWFPVMTPINRQPMTHHPYNYSCHELILHPDFWGVQKTWSAIVALRVGQLVLSPASAASCTAPILTNSYANTHTGQVSYAL